PPRRHAATPPRRHADYGGNLSIVKSLSPKFALFYLFSRFIPFFQGQGFNPRTKGFVFVYKRRLIHLMVCFSYYQRSYPMTVLVRKTAETLWIGSGVFIEKTLPVGAKKSCDALMDF
ncbi:MAG: hypothetical protein LBD29_05125, partial [Treponema sp.]|nr:hypothetical protein [Treponema sp.]